MILRLLLEVKRYTFINENNIDLDLKFYIHSELLSNSNNHVGCKISDYGMIQYAHDFMLSTICSDKKVYAHQINGSKNTIKSTNISDNAPILLS